MKFDMGSSTLTMLARDTGGSHDDLGQLVRALVDAVQPLEGKFNGQGRAAFDAFKQNADQVSADLNGALAAILHGQQGMDGAFHAGDAQAQDNATRSQSQANFSAASFSAGRG